VCVRSVFWLPRAQTTGVETTPAREAPRVKVIYEGREELASGWGNVVFRRWRRLCICWCEAYRNGRLLRKQLEFAPISRETRDRYELYVREHVRNKRRHRGV